MNRPIKFRGQREDTKEWVYGSLIEDKYIVGNVIDWNEDYFNTEYWWRIIPETVGQFTGLYDKNGIEIYEGDIVIGENYLFPCYDNRKLTIEWLEKDCGFDMRIFNMNEIEVIGNIHDNKELLK